MTSSWISTIKLKNCDAVQTKDGDHEKAVISQEQYDEGLNQIFVSPAAGEFTNTTWPSVENMMSLLAPTNAET